MTLFPTVVWGQSQVTFLPAERSVSAEMPRPAALVFALTQGRFVVADIQGRGWCIPGGRLEPDETPEQAVRREAMEEAGITLGPLHLLGHFIKTERETGAAVAIPAFMADVVDSTELPSETESRGVGLLSPEALPIHYYTWDTLLEAVFAYAWQEGTAQSR
jgi:8-oxo-dGTP diphosphatase